MKTTKNRCRILEMLMEMLDLDVKTQEILDIQETQKPGLLTESDTFVCQVVQQNHFQVQFNRAIYPC